MYADDSAIYMTASSTDQFTDALQRELQLVVQWVVNIKYFFMFLKLNVLCLSQVRTKLLLMLYAKMRLNFQKIG